MTHTFVFADGYTWAVDTRKVLTLRQLYRPDSVSWSATYTARGLMPPGPPTGSWVVTCPDGVERVVPSAPPLAPPAVQIDPAPTVQDVIDIAISEATVPVEEPVVEVKKGKKGRAVA